MNITDEYYLAQISFAADVIKKCDGKENFDIKFGSAMMIAYQFDLYEELDLVMSDLNEMINAVYS